MLFECRCLSGGNRRTVPIVPLEPGKVLSAKSIDILPMVPFSHVLGLFLRKRPYLAVFEKLRSKRADKPMGKQEAAMSRIAQLSTFSQKAVARERLEYML